MNEQDCKKLNTEQLIHVVQEWEKLDGNRERNVMKMNENDLVDETKRILTAIRAKWNSIEFPKNQKWAKIAEDIKNDKKVLSLKIEILETLSDQNEFRECNFLTYNEILTDELISLIKEKLIQEQRPKNFVQTSKQRVF